MIQNDNALIESMSNLPLYHPALTNGALVCDLTYSCKVRGSIPTASISWDFDLKKKLVLNIWPHEKIVQCRWRNGMILFPGIYSITYPNRPQTNLQFLLFQVYKPQLTVPGLLQFVVSLVRWAKFTFHTLSTLSFINNFQQYPFAE